MKLTWLAETSLAPLTPVTCVHFENIMTKAKLDENDKFEDFVNHNSRTDYDLVGEPDMSLIKKGDIIQILRKGYYICDSPYDAATKKPCLLFNIPDGGTKEKPTSLKATDTGAKSANEHEQAKASGSVVISGPEVGQLAAQIMTQGDVVRDLKANKSASKVKYFNEDLTKIEANI